MQFDDRCLTYHVWNELSAKIYTYLNGVTLGELTDRPEYHALKQQSSENSRSHMFLKRSAA